MDSKGSEIIEFYKGKSIFITGATGFVGKLVVEQLLRKCEPKKLYLLIRNKKDVDPKQRLHDMFDLPMFERLKKEKPKFVDAVEVVDGDSSKPDLGLSNETIATLVDQIEIVFHGAATVRFNEHIKISTNINVLGTKNLVLLCRRMKNLKSFIHVSTAFSHCPRMEIDEVFYDTPMSCDNLIKFTECVSDDKAAKMTTEIMEDWPNAYSFTKAVAEDAVRTYGKGLPVAVFRPGIITNTKNEPVKGWIDNLYGPVGLSMGVGLGVIRVFRGNLKGKGALVPADYVVNAIIAAGYKTNLMGPTNDIAIYNYVPADENPITWGEYMNQAISFGKKIPPSRALWYFSLTICKNYYSFLFLHFLLHILPAFFIDGILIALNKKPQAMKIYQKIGALSDAISYFSLREWKFHDNNVQALWSGLNKKDKELFHFDIRSLDWPSYVETIAFGLRIYLLKDPAENIPWSQKRFFWLHIVHRIFQLVVVLGLLGSTMWITNTFILS